MDNDMISGNHTCQSFVYMHVKNTFQKKNPLKCKNKLLYHKKKSYLKNVLL